MTIKYKNGTVYQLKPGDRIVVPKSSLRLVAHHAIYVGYHKFVETIIENHVDHGVRLISVNDFIRENPEALRVEPCKSNSSSALNRAFSRLGYRYNLSNHNCEHFANYVQHGDSYSPQKGVVLLGLGLLGLFALSRASA